MTPTSDHGSRITFHVSRFALLAIILLAALLRWQHPTLVEFKYDEAHITGLALDLAAGGPLPLLSGGTTLGIQRPALDVYLLAGFLKLGGRVEAAVWGLAALGVLAVALTYALGRRVGGGRVGLLAALFMAANPWLVFYDRKLWAHLQVVFSVGLLLLAWAVVARRRRRAAFWFPALAALQGLTHILAVVQGLSWLAAAAIAPRRWFRRETGWGLAVAAGLVSPYLWALWQRWQARSTSIASLVPAQPDALAAPSPIAAWREALHLFAGTGFNRLAALPISDAFWWRVTELLAPLVLLLIALGLARTARWALSGPRKLTGRLLLAWTVGPCVAYSLGLMDVAIQYWTALLPLPALYFALGLDGAGGWLARRLPRRPAQAAVIGLAIADRPGLGREPGGAADRGRGGRGGNAFGVPLGRWQAAMAEARAWADRLATQEVRVAVAGVDPGYDSEPAAVAALLGNPPYARFVAPSSPPALLLAHDRPSLYLWAITAPDAEQAVARLGERVWEGLLAADRPLARLYRLPAAAVVDLDGAALEPVAVFDVGLALIRYAFPADPRAGAPFQVTLTWHVLDVASSARTRDITAFNHIVDAAGNKAAQVDGLALLSRDWWPGDVVMQPYSLTLPAGAYRWQVGLYSRTDGGRAQVSVGGDFVELGPLVVH